RRNFLRNSMVGGAGLILASGFIPALAVSKGTSKLPAILGGTKSHSGIWPDWPVWRNSVDDEELLKVMRSGVWSRAQVTSDFEKKWAEMTGTQRCLSVVNGTNALITSLAQYDIGAGD